MFANGAAVGEGLSQSEREMSVTAVYNGERGTFGGVIFGFQMFSFCGARLPNGISVTGKLFPSNVNVNAA